MSIPATADLWWKNAIIYCLDVQTFADSNGDGIVDFGGSPPTSTTWPDSGSPASG